MNQLILYAFLCISSISFSQLKENFDDGNFNTDPTWNGSSSKWIINSNLQLQSNDTITGTSYLSTNYNLNDLDNKEWRFWLKLAFSPSTSNYARVYLTSTNSNLAINPDGFYVQFGEAGTKDPVRLYKRENNTTTLICSGIASQIAKSFMVGIRVLRDNNGNWKLFVDPTGGESFTTYSTGNDPTPIVGNCFGIFCKYSTSNTKKFYFDRVYVGNEILDNTPPILISTSIKSSNQIDVLFDQEVDSISGQIKSNYTTIPPINIKYALIDSINNSLVHIEFDNYFKNGQTYQFNTNSIADNAGNISQIQTNNFSYLYSETPQQGDIIISEFMVDPTPVLGLPETEYVEIYNRSDKIFNLENWKIGDAVGFGTLSSKWFFPDQYLIICSSAYITDFSNTISASSYPSYNNEGDSIILKDFNGNIIDQLNYSDAWYKDEIKKDGGYSVERINLLLPCSTSQNWAVSNASIGGTPGLKNSIDSSYLDTNKPIILNLTAQLPNQLIIQFNEGMDTIQSSNSTIAITPSLGSLNKNWLSINELKINFQATIQTNISYKIVLPNFSDCSFNNSNLEAPFSLPAIPEKGDLIINEILFNPLTGGNDFVEIYNKSDKTITLKGAQIANIEKGEFDNFKSITANINLKNGEYLVLTADTLFQQQHFPYSDSGKYIQQFLPNFNIDSGTVALFFDNELIDKVSYKNDWHFTLIEDTKGKSLERIDQNKNSNDSTNWHTAAESINFGTPARKNSQDYTSETNGEFQFLSKTISPDNDGFEDVLKIHYQLKVPGMIGTFTIYDNTGRTIKTVINNELLATEGVIIWDGTNNEHLKTPIGTYIGVFNAFDATTGMKINKTKAFVVAGKL